MQHTQHKLHRGGLALRCQHETNRDRIMALVRREAEALARLDDRTPDETSYMEAMQADLADYNAEFE